MILADDLFAGSGGWDLAARRLGIHSRGVEKMEEARATRDAADLETIHDDVWTYIPDAITAGQIASPPCQTFSKAGKGEGRRDLQIVLDAIFSGAYATLTQLRNLTDDERTGLVLTPLHFALTGNYEWLAWEQVPSVLPIWEACAEVLRENGWSVWTGKLNAEQYGVPQTRTRAILMARKNGPVAPPVPTHSRYYSRSPQKLDEGVLKWVSMAEALGWGLEDVVREVEERLNNQSGTKFDLTWPANRPAPVVAGREIVTMPGANANRFNGSTKSRNDGIRVTVAEAGVLQSFPADFPWQGNKKRQFEQVGNAIPPLLAEAVLAAVTDG